jgi:sorbitol/mannitol transport system permease protein
MTTVAEKATSGTSAPPPGVIRKTSAWARRAPLLPALIFMIVVTQLPFVATLVISFMDWNAYYPDERGFAGVDNFVRVAL